MMPWARTMGWLLALTWPMILGCGGAQSGHEVKPKVVIEDGTLFLIDELSSDSVPMQIHFEVDSDVLEDQSRLPLDVLAEYLIDNDEPKLLEVQGHSDEQGSRQYNLDLSERRARAVRAYLIEQGVPPERLRARGFGARRPLVRRRTLSAWAKNRRVEFAILNE